MILTCMLTTRKETAEVGQKGHRLVLTEKHLFGEFSKGRDWSSIINSETDFSLKVVITLTKCIETDYI